MLDAVEHEMESLEVELERIITVAEKISKKALSTTENLAGKTTTKKQKSVRKSKSSLACRVLSTSCKRPRLSSLAARAALAAAVTPLRQGSKANVSEKSQEFSVHLTGPSSMVFVENGGSESLLMREYLFSSACNQIFKAPVKGAGSSPLVEWDQDIELVIDIPVQNDFFLEESVNLVVDIPVLGSY